MSTRARIGRINANGSITSIYSHWDGYLREGSQWTPYGVTGEPQHQLVSIKQQPTQLEMEVML